MDIKHQKTARDLSHDCAADVSNEDVRPAASCCPHSAATRKTAPNADVHTHDHDHDHGPSLDVDALEGLVLHVPAMDCALEEGQIRAALTGLRDVHRLQFDLNARVVAIDSPESNWDEIVERIAGAGFESKRLRDAAALEESAQYARRQTWKLIGALGIAISAELIHLLLAPSSVVWMITGMVLAALAIGMAGLSVLKKGWQAILRADLNINALMSVAVVGAFLIADWPEAAMVMTLYSLAELIEARAVSRARNAVKGLLDLAPAIAQVLQPDGQWAQIDARQVKTGALVRVRPGERFAFDGQVLQGYSSADQSAITGESIPVEKEPGDKVYAGTVNQQGELQYEVLAPANDTVLARIIHVVEQAQATRAPIQRFVDRFAAIYTPAVFLVALLVAVGGPLVFGAPWLASVYKGLVLLVIGCPCALVISTPVTIVSGLTAAARFGVLIKGGVYLELARGLQWIAMDKTGTLTQGKPKLVHQHVFETGHTAHDVLSIAAGLARRSDHPVSGAIGHGLEVQEASVEDFTAVPGRGVQAQVGGVHYKLGSHRWIHALELCTPEVDAELENLERQGYTLSLLATDQEVLAAFAVADTVRETSRQAVSQLRDLGVKVMMLTGDHALTAKHIGAQVGIDEVRADMLPEDKLEAIRSLREQGLRVGMAGDGINDSPALATADIGFAMGQAGTDIAVEAADVVVMTDDLRRIPKMIRLSHKVHRVLWQNISLALGIKAVFLVLAIMDQATMWMAVFADMGASLLVVFNGLRLIRAERTSDDHKQGA